MGEKLGIDVLQKGFVTIARFSSTVAAAVEDKNVTFTEWMAIAGKGLGFISVVKTFSTFIAQLKDLDVEEKNALVETFVLEFDLTNDAAEKAVEDVVAFILAFVQAGIGAK